jgi:hypothetical protein
MSNDQYGRMKTKNRKYIVLPVNYFGYFCPCHNYYLSGASPVYYCTVDTVSTFCFFEAPELYPESSFHLETAKRTIRQGDNVTQIDDVIFAFFAPTIAHRIAPTMINYDSAAACQKPLHVVLKRCNLPRERPCLAAIDCWTR